MKSLKVTGRNKTLILPAKWIEGMDHELDNADSDETDGDYNEWVDEINEENNDEDDGHSENENKPVTDEEVRQLREDEAQRAMNETRNEREYANQTD